MWVLNDRRSLLTFVDPQIVFSSQFFILVKVLSDYYHLYGFWSGHLFSVKPYELKNVILQLYFTLYQGKKQVEHFRGFSENFLKTVEVVVDEIGVNSTCQRYLSGILQFLFGRQRKKFTYQ